MSNIGDIERKTQKKVIKLFEEKLKYRYLGDFTDRDNNSNVETEILTDWLLSRGISKPNYKQSFKRA